MNPSQLSSDHLRRKAVLYVRQSSLQQVREHRESTARQYALKQRALGLGWRSDQILVVDEDQALSAASAGERHGFQRLVSDVGLGGVGIVMGLEVSRLARNNADWHRLLEICALADTLILDEDGIYDPGHFNDRLLLGLKGAMSEAELHMLRARLLGGKLNKARRGELRVPLPVGLVHDRDGQVVLDPDREVQGAVREVFQTFRRTGSAFAVERHFAQEGLLFPKRLRSGARVGEVVWTPLLHERILETLHNPRYAGAYVYGRSRTRRSGPGGVSLRRRLPRDEWQVFIPDAHPGYITWQEYEANLARLRVNSSVRGQRDGSSPPREGPALLQGLVLCGRCGRRMIMNYRTRGNALLPTYLCKRRDPETGKRCCQSIAGTQLDQAVGQLVVQAVTPTSLDVTLQVFDELRARQAEVDQLRRAQVERARYEAQRAEWQFMLVNPENRLVADTLERQWDEKLRAVAAAEEEYNRWTSEQPLHLSAETRERILTLAEDFPSLWNDPRTPNRERKRMLRLMIEDITLTKGEGLRAEIRWKGGATTTLELPRPLGAGQLRKTPEEVLRQISHLSASHTDAEIAGALNGQGLVSGTGQSFTARLVRGIRRAHAIEGLRAHLGHRGWVMGEEMARRLGVSPTTIGNWRHAGRLNARRCDGRGYLYEDPGDQAPRKRQGRRLGQRV